MSQSSRQPQHLSPSADRAELIEAHLMSESSFEDALEWAATNPDIPLLELWVRLDQVMAIAELSERLRQAGEGIAQIVEVIVRRAEHRLEDWELKHTTQPEPLGPVLDDAFLEPFLRQSQTLHLEELLEDYEFTRTSRGVSDTVVGTVEKEVALQFVAQLESEASALSKALSLAHDEDYSRWCKNLLGQIEPQVQYSLMELCSTSDLSLVQVWMTLLLNPTQFHLSQQWSTVEEFYDQSRIQVIASS